MRNLFKTLHDREKMLFLFLLTEKLLHMKNELHHFGGLWLHILFFKYQF